MYDSKEASFSDMNSYYFWLLCYILDCSDVLAGNVILSCFKTFGFSKQTTNTNIFERNKIQYFMLTGLVSLTPHEESIITKTFNEIDGYWTDKRVRDAMANPMEVDTTTIKYRADRVRRQAESVWTDEAIRSAVPIEAEAPLEALRELGIYPSESPPLEADLSPKHIVDVDEYPYNNFGKLLVSDSSGSHHCTAAFIRERVLITAAHCVKHANGDWYDHVRFYQRFNGMDDQGRIVEVEKMFVPPRYVDRNGVINLRWIR